MENSDKGFLDSWSLPAAQIDQAPNNPNAPKPKRTARPDSWDPDAPAAVDTNTSRWGQSEVSTDSWNVRGDAEDTKEKQPEPSSISGWGNEGVSVSARPSRPISQEVLCVRPSDSGLVTPADSLQVPTPVEANGQTNVITLDFKEKTASDKLDSKTFQTEHLGRGYLSVKTRRRVTVDGGRSLLATESSAAEKEGKLP